MKQKLGVQKGINPKVHEKVCLISAVPGTLWGFYGGLIKQLKASSVDVTIASSNILYLDVFRQQVGCRVFPVEITRQISPQKDLAAICKHTRHLRREKYDIVHAHTPKGGLVGMVSAFVAGIPHRLYTIHGLPLETATGLKRCLLWLAERLSCKLATQILAVSPSLREKVLAEKLCPAGKIRVLGNGTACGIDLEKFKPNKKTAASGRQIREKLNIPEDALVVGFVGRIVPDKGIETLVGSFVKLQRWTANIHLLFVGWLETIRESLSQETLDTIKSNDNIHPVGHVGNPIPFYAAMDIFVLPSRREGFGLTLIEAGALGLPVIATRVTGCVDAVVDNVTGLLVDVDDEEQLAEAMLKLAQDTELRNKLGRQGRERVRKLFDSKRLIAEHISLYEKILGEKIGTSS
jgi:glycosyltransferase involved in cell wall biosynthesis